MPSFFFSFARRVPFLYFLFPFVIGILGGWFYFPFGTFDPVWAFLIFVVVAAIMALISRGKAQKTRMLANGMIFLLLLLFGLLLSWWHNDSLRVEDAGRYLSDSSYVKVLLESPLTQKAHSWKAKARILAVKNGQNITATHGKAFLYFQKGREQPNLQYGDILVFANHLQRIRNSGNPGAFDYQRYCRVHKIGYTAFLTKNAWTLVKRDVGNRRRGLFLQLRKECIRILQKYIAPPREAGVATALLLGYREDLDPQLVQAFANVGVVHLIAISGLHVGLIYLILVWLFGLLPDKTRKLQGLLIGIGLWSFALLTGAHPSTLRATVMFSCFVIGKFFVNREGDSFNILAASAFLLLCFRPYLLFDVGFQLSYLAVAGILAFQKPLSRLLWSRYKLVNYLWDMLAVSIAAQIFVFPLVLFYFHQFPVFFLFSNLLFIPVATVALYGEVVLLVASFVPWVAHGIGWLVTKILFFMDEGVLLINRLPFVRWEYFHLTFIKLCCLYIIIGCICLWLCYKYKSAVIYGLLGGILLIGVGIANKLGAVLQKEVIVYNVAGASMMELISGRSSQLYGSQKTLNRSEVWEYTLRPAKRTLHIRDRVVADTTLNFFVLGNKKFVKIKDSFAPSALIGTLPVDYVILSRDNQLSIKKIADVFSPGSVVFDASVYNWQREKWKSACKKLNLHCFSVPDKGAWCLSLKK